MPEVYTHGHHESVLRSHKWRTAQNSAAYLLPHLAADATVLDVGCGPGTITADLADRVRALREMRRVTRPGGLVAVRDADYGGMTWYPAAPALDDWLALYGR